MNSQTFTKPLVRAGVFIGVGLGGFVDGIVFHQMLQFHSMLMGQIPKDTLANTEINMFWDGIFHSFTWVMTVVGIILLFRAHNVRNIFWTGRGFTGALFLGWGLFNLIEGIISHHILHLHHVVESKGESVYDVLFLISGGLFIAGGWWAIRTSKVSAPNS